MGRIPLWWTLVPLLLGVGGWWLAWGHWRDRLESDLAAVLPEMRFRFQGFPYRIAARSEDVRLRHADVALVLGLDAEMVQVNRQPFRTDRQVLSFAGSRMTASLAPLQGAAVAIAAPFAQASLRREESRIARLSGVWERPRIELGFSGRPVRATTFEAHLRETPAPPAAGAGSAPSQVQVVLAGTRVRWGSGQPLGLRASFDLLADRPVASLAGWRPAGQLAMREFVLSDATGEVLRAAANFSAGDDGRVMAQGMIETVCPGTLRAAADGAVAPQEKRTRKPVRVAFEAVLGERLELAPPEPGRPPPPVRAQAPDCPRFL
jgi:hypothetical protein